MAAAGVMGWSEDEVVSFGVKLACAWILKRVEPEIGVNAIAAERVRKWDPKELCWALGSSFGSTKRRSGGSSESRRGSGKASEIMSVGSVLRALVDGKPRSGR
jgi:hypothetical protein